MFMEGKPRLQALWPWSEGFSLLWFGQFVSNLGTQVSLYALGLWMFQGSGALASFASIAVVVQVARVLAMPMAGRHLNRWSRRSVMLGANGLGALATSGLAFLLLVFEPRLPFYYVLPLVALSAAAEAVLVLAFSTLIPRLVPASELGRANGLFVSSDAAVTMAAPLLGASLLGASGLGSVVLLDGISFMLAMFCVWRVRWSALHLTLEIPFQEADAASGRPERSIPQLLSSTRTRPLLVLSAALAFALGAAEMMFPAWVVAGLGTSVLGPALLAAAAGNGAGLLFWFTLLRDRWSRALEATLALQAVILVGAGLAVFERHLWIWFIGVALFSAGVPIALAALQSLWQAAVPYDQQPRLFAARYSAEWSARLAAFVLGTVVVDHWIGPLQRAGEWDPWLVESLGTGGGRPMALALCFAGCILLLCLASQQRHLRGSRR